MNATVSLVHWTYKKRKDGTSPIYLRVIANRKPRYLSTKVYIHPKYWNERKQEVRATHELAPTLNDALKAHKARAMAEAVHAKSATEITKSLKGSGGSLTAYFEKFIDHLDKAGRFWDWKKYRVTYGKLTDVFDSDIDFNDLDQDALIKWERYLREQCHNADSTLRKEMQRLRRIYKAAIKEGVLTPDADPFLVYDRPKAKRPERRKLSLDDIHALRDADLEEGSWEDISRDIFLFAFYAAGMRFGDVCRLTNDNVVGLGSERARIRYKMAKTGNPLDIPIPSPAVALIQKYEADEKYLFPLLRGKDTRGPVKVRRHIGSMNAMVNRYLKKVAEVAGIEAKGLSMHIARHSWADYARRKSGNLYAISKSLGHGDLSTTETYLKSLDQQATDQLAEDLWD